ncbi:MAG: hypothetical protein IT423_06715, partial [Pirellulaceae bacterium]|nr:hypothetical protein [Pirellulaceae bacterium]
LKASPKPLWIIFSEKQSTQLSELMREAVALLPEKMRWKATFSTYCTSLPPDVDCKVRCVVAGSDEARMSIARGDVIDLTKKLGVPPDSPAVLAARAGQVIGGEEKPAPKSQSVRALPASSIGAADSLAPDDEYELQPEDLVSQPPTAPKKLPPRPLVPPKHLKVPQAAAQPTTSINPVWFIVGVSAVIAALLLAVTAFLLMRPKPAGGEQAQNNSQTGNAPAPELHPTATPDATPLPLEPVRPPVPSLPEASGDVAGIGKPVPKLICKPTAKELDLGKESLGLSTLTQVCFEGSDRTVEPSKIKIKLDGQDFKFLEVSSEGFLTWSGEKPKLKTETQSFEFEILYDMDGTSVSTNFSLRLKAGANPDLEFNIVDSTQKTQPQAYALGAVLTPSFIRDQDPDEIEPGSNRQWTWERNNQVDDKWAPIHDKDKYTVTLADIGQLLRVRLTYPTRNNEGHTVVVSPELIVMDASVVEISVEKLLAPMTPDQSISVKVSPPQLSTTAATSLSYGESKTSINRDTLTLPAEKLLDNASIESMAREFDALRAAHVRYAESLEKWKGPRPNLVLQLIRNELFLGKVDTSALEAKCNCALQRRKLEPIIAQVLRFGKLQVAKDKKEKEELAELEKGLVEIFATYSNNTIIQPLVAKLPQEQREAILSLTSEAGEIFRVAWEELGNAEQAFFDALQAAVDKELPLTKALGRIAVTQTSSSTVNNPLAPPKVQKLMECDMAVQVIVTVPEALRARLQKVIIPKEAAPPPAADKPK